MSRECVRCVATLALKELCWEDPPGCPIHLEGPPIFLRVCVLGQLQHSPLLRPTFPLELHPLPLTFDRVFSNCSDPSLLKEILTGEHVSLEMVQVTEDYDGGTILARHEAPAAQFLFPDTPFQPGQLRSLALNKSRKYQYCPHLTLTTSISVTTLTIHTPFPMSSPWKPPAGEIPVDIPKSTIAAGTATENGIGRKVGVAPQDKLRLLLESYAEPSHHGSAEGGVDRKPKQKFPHRKFCCKPSTGAQGGTSKSGGSKFRSQQTHNLYRCLTADIGPHDWSVCPRRNTWGVICGGKKTLSKSAPHLEPDGVPRVRNLGPSLHKPLPPRPFMTGKVDRRVLGRRDFCGQQHMRLGTAVTREGSERETVREAGTAVRGLQRRVRESEGWRGGSSVVAVLSQTTRERVTESPSLTHEEEDQLPLALECNQESPAIPTVNMSSESESETDCDSGSSSPSCDSHVTGSEGRAEFPAQCDSGDNVMHDQMSSPQQSPTHYKILRRRLLSKYLWNGNGGMGSSPGGLIEHKLQTLIQDCCECKRSAESLGNDEMCEDDERLRASLSAERDDLLNKSAKLLPNRSVLVGLGGEGGGEKERDFWSERMAQFQGKHHRLVFSETMERIYSKLYQNALNLK